MITRKLQTKYLHIHVHVGYWYDDYINISIHVHVHVQYDVTYNRLLVHCTSLQYYSTHRSGRVSCCVRSGATMGTPPPTALLSLPSLLTAPCLHLAYNTVVHHLQTQTFQLNLNTWTYIHLNEK